MMANDLGMTDITTYSYELPMDRCSYVMCMRQRTMWYLCFLLILTIVFCSEFNCELIECLHPSHHFLEPDSSMNQKPPMHCS